MAFAGDHPVFFTDISVAEQLDYRAVLGEAPDPSSHADELPVTFSRGWRQRTALACALARGTPVLLIDEPFAGLDAAGQAQFRAVVSWCGDRGRAVVVATHDLAALEAINPRLVRLDRG